MSAMPTTSVSHLRDRNRKQRTSSGNWEGFYVRNWAWASPTKRHSSPTHAAKPPISWDTKSPRCKTIPSKAGQKLALSAEVLTGKWDYVFHEPSSQKSVNVTSNEVNRSIG